MQAVVTHCMDAFKTLADSKEAGTPDREDDSSNAFMQLVYTHLAFARKCVKNGVNLSRAWTSLQHAAESAQEAAGSMQEPAWCMLASNEVSAAASCDAAR
jgi:hypothetical protein